MRFRLGSVVDLKMDLHISKEFRMAEHWWDGELLNHRNQVTVILGLVVLLMNSR